MANIRLIRRRIKTARSIAQITKAMELVAAAKMKKAQLAAQAGKLYASKIYEMVMHLASRVDWRSHPLLSRPPEPVGKRLLILISTNKGLCGGLNSGLFRFLSGQYPTLGNQDIITLGHKGADFLSRAGFTVKADFSSTFPWISSVPALVQLVIEEFVAGHYDGVDLVYNEFISLSRYQPKSKTILPLTLEPEAMKASEAKQYEFLIEPTVEEVFNALLPHYVENQVRDAILQAEASEHSARMIAMHNATDNALSLTQELTLVYNKARQEKITYEINDMVTARLAVEG